MAKGAKIGERLGEPRKGGVRDKDVGDLWRLMAVAEPGQTAETIAGFLDHPEIGAGVRQSTEWARAVIADPVSRERAKRSFEGLVDPVEIDRVFDLWHDVVPR